MGYEVMLGKRIVGFVNPDNSVNYDMDAVNEVLKELSLVSQAMVATSPPPR